MLKVAVAMSGGVDSSVTAALLKEEGRDVIGITMLIHTEDGNAGSVEDARKVAEKLGIPHHEIDLKKAFRQTVIDNFCHEYSQGRTPNPCVCCNKYIKFGELLAEARSLGADYLSTGHYARIGSHQGRVVLRKGLDRAKDQSYFLSSLTQEQLRQTILPLGSLTKKRVRELASEFGLSVDDKDESQEICFVPDNDYRRFVSEAVPESLRPGSIVDRTGNALGEHDGIINYTIGQRRGLGIASTAPYYVVSIDAYKNLVTVGTKEEVYSDELVASEINWMAFDEPDHSIEIDARIRYRHKESRAVVMPLERGRAKVTFESPQMAITPGQTVVFYQGDLLVGGGIIE